MKAIGARIAYTVWAAKSIAMPACTLATGRIINRTVRAGSTQKVETLTKANSGKAISMEKAHRLLPTEERIPAASNLETNMVKEASLGRTAAIMRAIL